MSSLRLMCLTRNAVIISLVSVLPAHGNTYFFNPPDSLDFEISIESRRKAIEDGKTTADDKIVVMQSCQVRATALGWRFDFRPHSWQWTKNGKPQADTLKALIENVDFVIPYTITVTNLGQLDDVTGLDSAISTIKRLASPDYWDRIKDVVTVEAFSFKLAVEWLESTGVLVGKRIQVGATESDTTSTYTPFGTQVCEETRTQSARVPCEADSCIVTEFRQVCDSLSGFAVPFQALLGVDLWSRMVSLNMNEDGSRASLDRGFAQVMDPRTMLIHSKSSWRTFAFDIDFQVGPNKKILLKEERTYKYVYPQQ